MHAFKEFLEYLFREIRGLLLPQTLQLNCTHADFESDPPAADVFLQNLEGFQIVFLIIGSTFTFLIMILAIIQWYYVWTYISIEKRQNKLYFLISLFPVSTGCCLVAMYCPRTAILVSSLGLLYFLTCLFVLVSLIRHLADGRASLSLMLRQHGKMINFQSPPFCCCMPCLPKILPTEKNLRRLEWIVLQAPIVRALIVLSEVVAVAEKREHAIVWIQFCDVASLASLLMAIFGIHTLARLVSDKLSRYGFMGIFRIVDLSLLFFSAQQPILFENIFLRFGVITCGPLLSPHDNARFICNFVIICELFLLSLLATFLVSPARNNLFDLYHDKSRGLHQTSGSSSTTEETLLTIDA